jgi:hypothetical protein
MNCKPDQLAWIVVPRGYRGTGLEQLNNQVVKTLTLEPGYPEPIWNITPSVTVTFTAPAIDWSGRQIRPGETRSTSMLPDAFLRPFDPNSTPLNEPVSREVEHAA